MRILEGFASSILNSLCWHLVLELFKDDYTVFFLSFVLAILCLHVYAYRGAPGKGFRHPMIVIRIEKISG